MRIYDTKVNLDFHRWMTATTYTAEVVKPSSPPVVNPPMARPIIHMTGERSLPPPRSVLRYLDGLEKDPPVVRFWA